jgi:hypothetical protein
MKNVLIGLAVFLLALVIFVVGLSCIGWTLVHLHIVSIDIPAKTSIIHIIPYAAIGFAGLITLCASVMVGLLIIGSLFNLGEDASKFISKKYGGFVNKIN